MNQHNIEKGIELNYYSEPKIIFGYSQKMHDPHDGLTLFGPYETFSTSYSIQAGIIGTKEGILHYKNFVKRMNTSIITSDVKRPSYPGFQTIFNVVWDENPAKIITVSDELIAKKLSIQDLNKRTYELVNLYLNKIVEHKNQEEIDINIWFIIIPVEIWRQCRPKSKHRVDPAIHDLRDYKQGQGFLFSETEESVEEYTSILMNESDFHNQLKARLIKANIQTPAQIILESTLQFKNKYDGLEYETGMMAHLAWTQATTLYYKLGKLPWKLADIRDGVCYIGLVFKQSNEFIKKGYVCSAAQMFLDSGDGAVFRGNIGKWFNTINHEYHLDKNSAKELLSKALCSYINKNGKAPLEIFIHGRAQFNDEEWSGFCEAISSLSSQTKLSGIVIKGSSKLKLYRNTPQDLCNYGIMRGLVYLINDKEAFLWTRGFIPRLNTSSSLEIPNPLRIFVQHGDTEINTIIKDIFALTKLNYNACIYGDGLPVTLRFSDNIGDILTATDDVGTDMLPFKYYI